MAAHTPMRQIGGISSDSRKQPIHETSTNLIKQQIAYKNLMNELSGAVDPGAHVPHHLRQK